MTDRALDLDDIQGNVLGGFNTDVQILVALTNTGASFEKVATWVAQHGGDVTVASQVRAERVAMKTVGSNLTWLCLAVGARLLQWLQVLIRDDAFRRGMVRRAPSKLNDFTDPATWQVGASGSPVDVFFIVASNNEAAAVTRVDAFVESARSAGLTVSYREIARRLNDHEHFGFRDGISQPLVAGDDLGGDLQPGNFVFGYPRVAGGEAFAPVVDPRGVTDNGSLLVFRRLQQDVAAFRAFCADKAAGLQPSWPGLRADHLAALLVGRWPSGAPTDATQTVDPNPSDPGNSFDFSTDPTGKACPFGAHIRKVNPRNGRKDVLPVPRLLRRGIPFGRPYDETPNDTNRGLAFLAFQTSIEEQFEFLTQHWMNDSQNPGPGDDLLVGSGQSPRAMEILGPSGPVSVAAPASSWIIPTGGAYLFAPSRSGLTKFAAPAPMLGGWKVRQVLALALDSLKASVG